MIQALWFGSAVFVIVAAVAAFRTANNPTDAANVVGAILTRWHYLALLAPVALLALEWRRGRVAILILLLGAVLLAAAQALVDTRIKVMRYQSQASISSLPRESPLRRRFGLLHGVSSLLLIGQVIVAGTAIVVDEP